MSLRPGPPLSAGSGQVKDWAGNDPIKANEIRRLPDGTLGRWNAADGTTPGAFTAANWTSVATPATAAVAADTGNVFSVARTTSGRPATEKSGLVANATTYNGVVDPLVALGHVDSAAGGFNTLHSLEADWKTNPDITFTANTTSGSNQLTAASSTVGLLKSGANSGTPYVGATGSPLSGAGIPAGTTVVDIAGSTITMSANATATASGITVTSTMPRITEWYWQIIKADGSSRRPFYGRYDRSLGRAGQWEFMIGAGQDAGGAARPGFKIGWDDDTTPTGITMVLFSPNRPSFFPISTAGIAADENRLRMFSAAGKGSAISLTYNNADAEGTANPTFVLYTVGSTQANFYVGGTFAGAWFKPTITQPGLYLSGGVNLGDGISARKSLWSSTGAPAAGMGANGDWCISDNGSLYFKSAGAWAVKI